MQNLPLTAGFAVVLLLGLVFAPGPTGLAVAYGYVLTSPLGWLTAPLRRRWLGPDSVAPPRPRMPSVIMPPDADEADDSDDEDEADDTDEDADAEDESDDLDVVDEGGDLDGADDPDEVACENAHGADDIAEGRG
jgi:CDP-diacylglycerol--serine O-phosphatidyltransferase